MRRVWEERAKLFFLNLVVFFLFTLSVTWLPGILPSSLGGLAQILAWLLLFVFLLLGLAMMGFGPLAKRLNKVAVEEDKKERSFYKVKQPWDD